MDKNGNITDIFWYNLGPKLNAGTANKDRDAVLDAVDKAGGKDTSFGKDVVPAVAKNGLLTVLDEKDPSNVHKGFRALETVRYIMKMTPQGPEISVERLYLNSATGNAEWKADGITKVGIDLKLFP